MARPTAYRPEYCQQLIDHMAQGYSFQSFAAIVDVCRDTLYEWERVHPEFSYTKKRAYAKCLLFWEQIGLEAVKGKIKGFKCGTYIFTMKNRFAWSDSGCISPD